MENNKTPNQHETLLNAGAAISLPKLTARDGFERDKNGIPYAIVPEGATLQSLESFLPPERATGSTALMDANSFCRYVIDFQTKETAIFANVRQRQIKAVFNYHLRAGVDADARVTKGEGDFSATLNFPFTREFDAWNKINGRQIKQNDFAEFIEEHARTIVDPSSADMLEMAMHLEGVKTVRFASGKRISNGQVSLAYEEGIETKGGKKGTINVPELFTIQLSVLEGELPINLSVRLRYAISEDGSLSFTIKIVEAEKIVDDAVKSAIATIEKTLSAHAYLS